MPKRPRAWTIAIALLVLVVLIVVILASIAEEPVRRYVEAEANAALPGYHVTIGAVDLHPFTLSAEVRDIVLRQVTHPDPPVVTIPQVRADAQLAPLFSGRLGAELRVENPALAINQKHVDGFFRQQDAEDVKQQAEAWQERLRESVAFRGALYLNNGRLTYDAGTSTSEPLVIERIEMDVENITNRPNEQDEYPSTVRVSARFPDQSTVMLDGRADLLAIPAPRVEADVNIDRLQLNNLLPVAGRFNVQCRGGVLDLKGRVQYSKESTVVAIENLRVQDARIDYVHSAATKPKEVRRAKQVAEKAKDAHRDPTTRVKIEHAHVINSDVGFVNKATKPDYRVFISDLELDVNNLSNRLEEGTGAVKLTGKFMGSGSTVVTAAFRPEQPRPDLDLYVKIVRTNVEAFNDVLRAYGDMDAHRGMFAFFSEISVKNDQIHGYVKPLLKDVDVYDPGQDKDKPLTKKVYEAVVGGVLELFENKPRNEAATVTDLSGPVENPRANTWQVVGNLVQNAFFKAILPGFERVG